MNVHSRKNDVAMGSGLIARPNVGLGMVRRNRFRVECIGADGKLKWAEEFDNLVVNAGLDDSLDKHLLGSAYTAAWYVGLTDGTPTPAAGDTMASHAGWAEITAYSEATREALTLGAVSGQSVDNSASKASFSINDSTTVGGAFVVNESTKAGATGVLYGVGAFTEGDRAVVSGDTLNVTVTATAAAS